MKRTLAVFAILASTQACAEFYVLDPVATLPAGQTSFQYYSNQQTKFLDALKTCSPFSMEVRDPTQPNLVITRQIFGSQDGNCKAQTMRYITTGSNIHQKPNIINCGFSSKDIASLTTPLEYDYVRLLGFNQAHARSYAFSLETPAMKEIGNYACRTALE